MRAKPKGRYYCQVGPQRFKALSYDDGCAWMIEEMQAQYAKTHSGEDLQKIADFLALVGREILTSHFIKPDFTAGTTINGNRWLVFMEWCNE